MALLREQEQETAHGVDLPLEAIERAEGGEMVALGEIVGHGGKRGNELNVYCLRPFENPPARRSGSSAGVDFVILPPVGLRVGFEEGSSLPRWL